METDLNVELQRGDEEINELFSNLETKQHVANLLEIPLSNLEYHIHVNEVKSYYDTFTIPKNITEDREIDSPNPPLIILQQKLNKVFRLVYSPKASTHGFCDNRSVVSNARKHVGKEYVLNVDIREFFPSIHFGRVRGMLMSWPYKVGREAATTLAQICCYKERLPQGAPTSPVLSNMICASLDSSLINLAKENRCVYTRYADDITFSTTVDPFPRGLAYYDENNHLQLGGELSKIFEDEDFEVNLQKLHLQHSDQRQEVTGLVVNEKLNVKREFMREVRAMLHAWEQYGLEDAASTFFAEYDTKRRNPENPNPDFEDIVRGKVEFIGSVRGKHDHIYRRMLSKIADLSDKFTIDEAPPPEREVSIFIRTEGETDWIHMREALKVLQKQDKYKRISISFEEFTEGRGGTELKKIMHNSGGLEDFDIELFIYDSDDESINKDVTDEGSIYKYWSDGKYAMTLPIPDHRSALSGVCIEHYYKDEDIISKDENDRRLFLSKEFDDESLRNKNNQDINLALKGEAQKKDDHIIDDEVYNREGENISLSKKNFSEMVSSKPEEFDFEYFHTIFNIINEIAQEWLDRQ